MRTLVKAMMTLGLACGSLLPLQAQDVPTYTPSAENLQARETFEENRFGIFLHWGLYSLFAQGEWYMTNDNIDYREYAKSAEAFYPHNFDAAAWVSAFKNAGARYICFTTRHHDGFSMWDTECSDYDIMKTPYGKDILRQLADECHRQGLKLHLYYSLIDWTREDFPIGRTGRGTGRKGPADWDSYYDFMKCQLRELLTMYGTVDCIWFDGVWDHDEDSIPFDWQLDGLYSLIHELQPACLVGNNHHLTPFPGEDIQIFERDVPGENKAGLSGQAIGHLPLETCQTMNGMWGYKVKDQNYKSTAELIQLLARTAGKGANLLLNIGPQPDGSLPAAALSRLKEIGAWMKENGEAIYKTSAGEVAQGDSVVSTRKGDRLFVHILSPNVTELNFSVKSSIHTVTTFPDGKAVKFKAHHGQVEVEELEIPKDCPDFILEIK